MAILAKKKSAAAAKRSASKVKSITPVKSKTSSQSPVKRHAKLKPESIRSQSKKSNKVRSTAVVKRRTMAKILSDLIDPEIEISNRKFTVSTTPSTPRIDFEDLGELPEAYGTKKLFISARDPYWLFAYWDLSWQQFHEYAAKAHDSKIFLKIFEENGNEVLQSQISDHVRNYYYHAQKPNLTFFAELGFYRHGDQHFEVISRSGTTTAPRDNFSPNTFARFATIPFEWSFRALLELIKSLLSENEELAEALARLQDHGHPFPFKANILKGEWTQEQEQALITYLGEEDMMQTIRVGSHEVTEWLRRRLLGDTTSGFVPGLLSSESLSSWSSPAGGYGQREFWMNVNAELIIYGSTDPAAKLRISGKDIDIRKDGTFTYHWSFPDGIFHIPVEATSPDNVEKRGVLLSFLRTTARDGEVTNHPQDPKYVEPLGRLE
ncbi:MAG: DUF4912 domain-containing protein [Verrucomicrobiota bacterium]|nr:DUF4912 domain-containing protein [Verrucomicrobiota bacterium]